MADLGDSSTANSSRAAGGPGHKTSSWVCVIIITIASVILAFAFVLENLPLAVTGGVVLLIGIALGLYAGIMEDAH